VIWSGPNIMDVVRASGREGRRTGKHHKVRCPNPQHPDATPSCDVDDDANVFICRSCGVGGGVVEFANLVGVRLTDLASGPSGRPPPPVRSTPAKSKSVPPTEAETRSIWSMSRSVLDDDEVGSFLHGRGVDAGDVDLAGVARALPMSAFVPKWARSSGGFWSKSGHRLLLRLFDSRGENVGIRARRICTPDDDVPKSLSPCGLSTKGVVLANSLGQLVLSRGLLADETPALELVQQVGVVIAEGDVDFLLWVTEPADSDDLAQAVFGIANTSWTDEIASRVPDGTTVTIRAHDDRPGREYARTIGRSLHPRCDVRVLEARR
jgi:hypothetical protein